MTAGVCADPQCWRCVVVKEMKCSQREVKHLPSASSGSYTAAHTLQFHNSSVTRTARLLFASSPAQKHKQTQTQFVMLFYESVFVCIFIYWSILRFLATLFPNMCFTLVRKCPNTHFVVYLSSYFCSGYLCKKHIFN